MNVKLSISRSTYQLAAGEYGTIDDVTRTPADSALQTFFGPRRSATVCMRRLEYQLMCRRLRSVGRIEGWHKEAGD